MCLSSRAVDEWISKEPVDRLEAALRVQAPTMDITPQP
jgi:hypothetical protein